MQLNEEHIVALEALWQGQLQHPEKTTLEKRLVEDQVFFQAAQAWKKLSQEGFKPTQAESEALNRIKNRLRNYDSAKVINIQESTKKRLQEQPFKNRRILYLSLAAAIILLLLWLSPLNTWLQPISPYKQHFAHLSRDNANLGTDIQSAEEAYDLKQYGKAYPGLLAAVAENGDSLNYLYAGVAALGSNQAEAARVIFETVLNKPNWALYQNEIRWYLALAYLEGKRIEEARPLLQVLYQEQGEYSQNAALILENLTD